MDWAFSSFCSLGYLVASHQKQLQVCSISFLMDSFLLVPPSIFPFLFYYLSNNNCTTPSLSCSIISPFFLSLSTFCLSGSAGWDDGSEDMTWNDEDIHSLQTSVLRIFDDDIGSTILQMNNPMPTLPPLPPSFTLPTTSPLNETGKVTAGSTVSQLFVVSAFQIINKLMPDTSIEGAAREHILGLLTKFLHLSVNTAAPGTNPSQLLFFQFVSQDPIKAFISSCKKQSDRSTKKAARQLQRMINDVLQQE